MFDFLKNKKNRELPLPPPPSPVRLSNQPSWNESVIPSAQKPLTFPALNSNEQTEYQQVNATTERPSFMLRGDFDAIRADENTQRNDFSLPEFPPSLPAPAEEKEVRVFDKTIRQEAVGNPLKFKQQEVKETTRVLPNPAFIAVEDYKRIVNDTNSIRARLLNAEGFVKKLSELKSDEARSLERWRSHLEDVEKKLAYVDQLIEKAEKV